MDYFRVTERICGCAVILFLFFFAADVSCAQNEQMQSTWQVNRYEINLQLDPQREYVSEKATIDIEAISETHQMQFMLNENLHLLDVRAARGILDYRKAGEVVTITLDPPLSGKNTLFMEIEGQIMSKRPLNRAIFMKESILLSWADYWYPLAENGWATSLIKVTLPASFRTVGPGKMIEGRQIGESVTQTWQSDVHTSFYTLAADTRWIIKNARERSFEIQTCLYAGTDADLSDRIVSSATNVLSLYSELFCPYPFSQVAFIELEGLEGPETFNGFIAYPSESLTAIYSSDGFDARFPSFLWWGYTIGGKGNAGWQWIRGLGSYAEYLYCERMRVPSSRFMETSRIGYLVLDKRLEQPFSELDPKSTPSLVYGKGAGIMQMLRYVIGDEKFFRALKRLYRERNFSSITIDELRESLDERNAPRLEKFFQEWFFRSGAPEFVMQYSVRETYKKEYRVDVKIVQKSGSYSLPVELMMVGRDTSRTEQIFVEKDVHDLYFLYDFKPESVVFDPQGKIFRRSESAGEQSKRLAVSEAVEKAIQTALELERDGKYDEAEQVYETALEIARSSRELFYNYARMEQNRKEYKKALSLYTKAEKGESIMGRTKDPLHPWCYIRKGNIFDLIGSRSKALKEYRKALDFPDLWNSRKTAEKYINEPYTEK